MFYYCVDFDGLTCLQSVNVFSFTIVLSSVYFMPRLLSRQWEKLHGQLIQNKVWTSMLNVGQEYGGFTPVHRLLSSYLQNFMIVLIMYIQIYTQLFPSIL